MCRTKSNDLTDRLGVYKQISDVPEHHRLEHYEAIYEDRDVWAEYVEETALYEQYESERFEQDTERAAHSWKTHVESQGRHHALARPEDVNTWCSELLRSRVVNTVYNLYWTRIAAFYEWLLWHTDHPHVYDPFLMAAIEYSAGPAGEVWRVKVGHWREYE